jgi:hypothetical protein
VSVQLAAWGVTLLLVGAAGALAGENGPRYLLTAAGLPHFLLGFAFALLSVRRGRPERRRVLAWLGAASAAGCALYAAFPIFDLVGAYFVLHMFRDEVYMIDSRREWRNGAGAAMPSAAGPAILGVALAAFLLGRFSAANRMPRPGGFLADPGLHLTGQVGLDLMIAVGAAVLLTALARLPDSWLRRVNLTSETRDLLGLFICVGLVAQLREATLVLAFYHYVSWYLFSTDRLKARSATTGNAMAAAAAPAGFWGAVTARPRPFVAFMLAANAASGLLLFLYLWRPEALAPLSFGFEFDYFPYWTIPHVTLSFLPRR